MTIYEKYVFDAESVRLQQNYKRTKTIQNIFILRKKCKLQVSVETYCQRSDGLNNIPNLLIELIKYYVCASIKL